MGFWTSLRNSGEADAPPAFTWLGLTAVLGKPEKYLQDLVSITVA